MFIQFLSYCDTKCPEQPTIAWFIYVNLLPFYLIFMMSVDYNTTECCGASSTDSIQQKGIEFNFASF